MEILRQFVGGTYEGFRGETLVSMKLTKGEGGYLVLKFN